MKILFLGINYWPEETGNATFVVGRCEYLAERGHEVTICTGYPYYPEWRVRPDYRRKWFMHERRNRVDIRRVPLYVPRRVTSFKRMMHEASFIASSFAAALACQRPDLLYVVSAPLGLAASAFFLSRAWQIPYAFYVSDMQPDAAAELGMLPGSILKVLYGLERFAYRHAALVPTLTEGMRQRIISKGVPAEKVVVFSHCAEQRLFEVPVGRGGLNFRRAHGLENHFIVLHAGNMGVKQGLEVVINAAARTVQDRSIVYLLVGDGVTKRSLQEGRASLGLENVQFLPVQPRDVFWDMLGAADACLITERGSVSDILFPGKTVDFLSAGRPVIASLSSDTETARIVSSAGAGLVVPPGDAEALAAAVMRLCSSQSERAVMGERGRAYAREHWDRSRVLPYMEEKLIGLVGTGNAQKKAG